MTSSMLQLAHLLLSALLVMPASGAAAAIVVENYADRGMFEARLGGTVQVVDFDDIATSGAGTPVAFDADRYAAAKGIVITGTSGQFVSQSFSFPYDFTPSSPPNMYAPGPMSTPSNAGGHDTDVSFVDGGLPALVAGFGAVFIDADYSQIGPSSLAIFDAGDTQLAMDATISGLNGSQLFRGFVTIDDGTNQAVATIARAHLVNGNEWPPRDIDEGVTLDDFVFGTPVTGSSTTTTLPGACSVRAATFSSIRCRLAALTATCDSAQDLGRLARSLRASLHAAATNLDAAESLAGASVKKANKRLRKASQKLSRFVHRLESRSGRRVPDATRTSLIAAAMPLVADVNTLRGSL